MSSPQSAAMALTMDSCVWKLEYGWQNDRATDCTTLENDAVVPGSWQLSTELRGRRGTGEGAGSEGRDRREDYSTLAPRSTRNHRNSVPRRDERFDLVQHFAPERVHFSGEPAALDVRETVIGHYADSGAPIADELLTVKIRY